MSKTKNRSKDQVQVRLCEYSGSIPLGVGYFDRTYILEVPKIKDLWLSALDIYTNYGPLNPAVTYLRYITTHLFLGLHFW